MNKINYQLALDKELEAIEKADLRPGLLLHACCAPCSSYVIEYLARYFDITVYFYNPNISPEEEYTFRSKELARLIGEMPEGRGIKLVSEEYNSDIFYNSVRGLEEEPEGSARCRICYRMRLRASAEYAAKNGFDYFTTTLSISPYKRSDWLNEIGEELSREFEVRYLVSDFKKKNGYKRSCALSEKYRLYRQNYCGCEFSKRAAEKRDLEKSAQIKN